MNTNMKNFKKHHRQKSQRLMSYVRSLSPSSTSLIKLQKHFSNFIKSKAICDVICDLTLKQSIDEYSPPVLNASNHRKKIFITEQLASANIIQFANRLNYRVYKNAYKRFNKRLDIVSCIEGGKKDFRHTHGDENKRLHVHLSIQRPSHVSYINFEKMILEEWVRTEWGYYNNVVRRYDDTKDYARYQTKYGLDSIDLNSTHIGASMLTTSRDITRKNLHLD